MQLNGASTRERGRLSWWQRVGQLGHIFTVLYTQGLFRQFTLVIIYRDNKYSAMWYLKQKASNAWNATRELLTEKRPKSHILFQQIVQFEDAILPTNKLNQLCNLTYESETFDQVVQFVLARLKVFKYDIEQARQTHNILIAVNYVVKHGATGFVDELRGHTAMFVKYQQLEGGAVYEDIETQSKLNYSLEKIKSRAQHIAQLLNDKKKLKKEKELSMLVRQKLKLYETEKRGIVSIEGNCVQRKEENSRKIDSFLERYLWKYVDKVDEKIQEYSDKIAEGLEKYIFGEGNQIQRFELDQEEGEEESVKEMHFEQYEKNNKQNNDDLINRIDKETDRKNRKEVNLLDFEEIIDKQELEENNRDIQLI